MNTRFFQTLVVFALLAIGNTATAQQAKTDAMSIGLRDAYNLHQKGDNEALTAKLRELLKLAEEAGAKKLASRLPETIGEWKGEEIKPEDLALLGGGTSLSRTYKSGDKKINVKVVKDSPVAKQLAPLLKNEEFLAISGRKTERISGRTAVYEGERKLQMILGDDLYLEVAGNEPCTSKDVAGLARKLDIRSLERLDKPEQAE
jgi:hypothetical protein